MHPDDSSPAYLVKSGLFIWILAISQFRPDITSSGVDIGVVDAP